jgi:hypothetical protein
VQGHLRVRDLGRCDAASTRLVRVDMRRHASTCIAVRSTSLNPVPGPE